jgi:hypothetical protein
MMLVSFSLPIFSQSPTIETIIPNWGSPSGGTDLVIKGTNFQNGAIAYINNVECTTTSFIDSETIQATSPDMGNNGIYQVKVQNPDSSYAIKEKGFNAIETVYYISEVNGIDSNNGTDPSTPKLSIQKLIDETIGKSNPPEGPIEIRLEQGTYKENLWLKRKVVLTGGWSSGFTERDPDQYITILDGDYDDVCARSWGTAATITVDGLTMINGRRIAGGGGYKSFDDYSTLTNNIIVSNRCETGGGGIFFLYNNDVDNSVLSNNIIVGNRTDYHNGGGISITSYDTYLWDLIPETVITSNLIIGNRGNKGGGTWIYPEFNESERFQIKHNIFAKNEAGCGTGGGLIFSDDATINIEADLKNNLFRDNKASTYGGGLLIDGDGEGIFTIGQHTVVGNQAAWFGDGFAVYDSNLGTVDARNSIFNFNNGDDVYDGPGTTSITYSDIEEGFPGTGNISEDPLFVNGPLGKFYLSQMATGDPDETMDSSCLDSGSGLASDHVMDSLITRTDEVFDSGMVDMGYHYGASAFPDPPDPLGIISILPSAGNFRGDDWIVIRGSGFVPGIRVFIDNVESGDVILMDDRKLVAEVPASVGEKRDYVNVEVRKPDDTSAVEVNGFRYVDVIPPSWDSKAGIQAATDAQDCQRGVILEWNSAADIDSPSVTFNVYRTTLNPWDDTPFIPTTKEYASDPDNFRPATFLANVSDMTYLDDAVSHNTTYWYIVEALDSAEIPNRELNGTISLGVNATTSSNTIPPEPVGNALMADTPDGGTTVHLDWMASKGAFKYNVYRGVDKTNVSDLIYTTEHGYVTEYDDVPPVEENILFYKIKAADSCSPANEADE